MSSRVQHQGDRTNIVITFFRMVVWFTFLNVATFRVEAQLTHTQRLIEREIIALDGRCESSNDLVWVEFQGRKFELRHFEMLAHLKKLRWFSAVNIKGSPDCFLVLKSLCELQRLDIESSGDTVEGISHLASHCSLREVQIEDAKLSSTVIAALQTIPNLQVLVLENVEIESKDGIGVVNLCKKCEVTLGSIRGLEANDLDTIIDANTAARRKRESLRNLKSTKDKQMGTLNTEGVR